LFTWNEIILKLIFFSHALVYLTLDFSKVAVLHLPPNHHELAVFSACAADLQSRRTAGWERDLFYFLLFSLSFII